MKAIILINDDDYYIIECETEEQFIRNIETIKGTLVNKDSQFATIFGNKCKILLPREKLLKTWIKTDLNYNLRIEEENFVL